LSVDGDYLRELEKIAQELRKDLNPKTLDLWDLPAILDDVLHKQRKASHDRFYALEGNW
jgi:hypothetical protein